MNKRRIIFTCLVAAAVAITAAFSLLHRPLGKPQHLKGIPVRLNDTLKNSMSDIPELSGMDKRIRQYMSKWGIKGGIAKFPDYNPGIELVIAKYGDIFSNITVDNHTSVLG